MSYHHSLAHLTTPDFVIHKEGNTTVSKRGDTGFVHMTNADAYTVIQDALDNGNFVFIKPGTYVLSDRLMPDDHTKLIGSGYDCILQIANNTQKDIIYVNAKTDVLIDGFSLDGNKANNTYGGSTGAQNGVNVYNSDRVVIQKVYSYGTWSHCFLLNLSKNCGVKNCYGFDPDRSCISLHGGLGCFVDANNFYACGNNGSLIVLHNNVLTPYISNNWFNRGRSQSIWLYDGVIDGVFVGNIIENNSFTNANGVIYLSGTPSCKNNLFIGNRLDSKTLQVPYGFNIETGLNNIIKNNTICNSTHASGVAVNCYGDDTIIEDNYVDTYNTAYKDGGTGNRWGELKSNNITTEFSIDGATRWMRGSLGFNAGNPGAAGDWNGNGFEGAIVRDTTGNKTYIYAGGGWREISAT